jgi:hypothetical protein
VKFLALVSKLGGDTATYMALSKYIADNYEKDEDKVFKLPKGVRIIDGGKVFGRFGLAIIYEAPNEAVAWDFLGEFTPYWKIERFLLTSCNWCERTKSFQIK